MLRIHSPASGGAPPPLAAGAATSSSSAVDDGPPPHAAEWHAFERGSAEADEAQRSQHLLVSHLTAEIDQLGTQQETFRTECEVQQKANERLQAELARLQAENSGLCHRVAREREIRAAAIADRARLETEIELDSERAFNSSALSSVNSSPALSHVSSSQTSLPPTWHLPSPRGLTPSMLTPSVLSSSSQLSPRAASPKPRDGRELGNGTPVRELPPSRERRPGTPGTPTSGGEA